MRFCKVAILVVSLTIISSGCASRQHNQRYRGRTYSQPAVQHNASQQQQPRAYHKEYESDPPAERIMPQPEPSGMSNGPSQPVPSPPAMGVSLTNVQGVSFSRSCSVEPTCALPTEVCANAEGCRSKSSCFASLWDKSKSLCSFRRFYRKPAATHCVSDSCGSQRQQDLCGSICEPNSTSEGCVTGKSCLPTLSLPKFSMPKLSKPAWLTKRFRKPSFLCNDDCVPMDEGCSTAPQQLNQPSTSSNQIQPFYRRSPLAEPLEDPFTQPAPIHRTEQRPMAPQPVPEAPTAVPDVPTEDNKLKPVAPMPTNQPGLGNAQPAQAVPAPPMPNAIDPMPSGNQTYVEPSIWPKLRTPPGRIANVPTSQTSWRANTQTLNPPAWSNPSPWSTSWQIR